MARPASPLFLTEHDLARLASGTHYRSYESLGAHPAVHRGEDGFRFAVWAPNADFVSVTGDFNCWSRDADPMRRAAGSGVWEAFVPQAREGQLYKYFLWTESAGLESERADPYAFAAEPSPRTASKICRLDSYSWGDGDWMVGRWKRNRHDSPISIYEVHLGSWMRSPDREGRWLTYTELAQRLGEYVSEMGFTHVELMPVAEHPFGGSWGYQTTGYFAPTSRFGEPRDFMAFVDALHRWGIGVILDWVPAHFPSDAHGLAQFDGGHLYEYGDERLARHPHWDTLVFDYARPEVANFLISSALFWFDKYHADGIRADAVASMLYRDYGRQDGQWIPNRDGGRENLEAVSFLQRLNDEVYSRFPDVLTAAEESTAWPRVSRATRQGGLGFGFKWNMGWMNDMLDYMGKDPVYRRHHHDKLTFSMMYAFSENFVLPLSHDEVVHMKGSIVDKMPGDDWQRFANVRLLYAYMYFHPGKKLLFMGNEIAQRAEWNHDASVDWHLLDCGPHRGVKRLVADLNRLYRGKAALHRTDSDGEGFRWVGCDDRDASVVSFLRHGRARGETLLVVCHFTPLTRNGYRLGVPTGGAWKELLNSDSEHYGGSNAGNRGRVEAGPVPSHGHPFSVELTLPPLAAIVFEPAASDSSSERGVG